MKNFTKPLTISAFAILLLGMILLALPIETAPPPRDAVPGSDTVRPEIYQPERKPQDEGELFPGNACLKNARTLPSVSFVAPGSETTSVFGARLKGAGHEIAQNQPLQRGLQKEREKEARPDQPDEALRWRMQQLVDENGIVPHNALIDAWEQTKRIPLDAAAWPTKDQSQNNSFNQNDDVSPAVAGIQPSGWTWLGPGNIGGRIRTILIHPTNSQIMWVGSVTGGIWKTANGGTSWAALDDFMGNLAVTSLVISPTDSNVIYAGTGEGAFLVGHHPAKDLIRGAGVFKTTNGGTTWTQIPTTSTSDWYYVSRLAINPTNGQIILAATNTGIWRSTDGGTSWSKRLSTAMLDINFDPTDGSKCVASGTSGAGARYSTDGGSTWTTATGLPTLGRIEIAYARSSPSLVYASVDNNDGEIYLSSDGGHSFSLRNSGTNYFDAGAGGQGWYDNIIWVDPTNPNIVIVGGIDLWRSTNGGTNLTRISQWQSQPQSAHADQHAIVETAQFNGSTNKTVFFGNDGGIYRVNDVYTVSLTSGWTELNNNLGITQFYSGAGNPTSGRIIGGTQDNGTLRYIGATETWDTPFGGDGGWSAADPNDSNYLYGEYVYLNIHRSTNGGATQSQYISGQYWDGFDWAWKPIPYRIPDAMTSQALFIAPFVLDPNNSSRILAGGFDLWRTNDAKTANTNSTGPSWASLKSSLGRPISAIAVAKGNSNVVWVGYNNGDVYFTSNGTVASPTWTRVDTNSPGLPDRYCTRITIDPTNSNRVYVTFGGFSSANVWRTENGGTTWTNISNNLPSAPVRTLAVWQQNVNNLYVGTEVGIFASANGGQSWSPSNDGPTNCPVDELFWMNDTLVAATHGRGMFSISITGSTGCTYSLSQTSQSFGSSGGNGSFSVTTSSGCAWSAVSNATWISTNSSGSGNGTISFAVAANTSAARSGTISVGGQTFTVNQSAGGGGCPSTTISSGQTINGTLTTSDCFFTGTTRYVDLYNFNGTTGQQIAITMNSSSFDTYLYVLDSGNQSIAQDDDGGGGTNSRIPAGAGFFTLPATGTYTLYATSYSSDSTGAYSITLLTGSNCTYSLSPTSQIFIASASTGSFNVSTGAGCSWTAISNASWLTTSSSGTGTGTVSYSVAANTGNARNGTISVGGQTFTVFQSAGNGNGCLDTSIAFGQTINTTLTTGCVFTGTSRYVDPYIFTGAAGQQIVIAMSSTAFDTYLFLNSPNNTTIAQDDDGGGGTNSRIPTFAGFFTLPASGTYRIFATSYSADGTTGSTGPYTISLLSPTSCSYSINPGSQSVASAAGSNSFSISAPASCTWTALSNASWITTSSSGSGNGTINYSFVTNTGAARSGTISVGGQIFTVNQSAGAQNYTITLGASPDAAGTVGGAGTFAAGSSRTVTASANGGYSFANWTENGSVVSSSASYNFTLNSNRTLVANFTAVNYAITLNVSPSGSGTVSGAGTFAAGSSRTVTATANTGYSFTNWTENGGVVSTSASYTFTLNGNRNLVANFLLVSSGNASYDANLKAPKCAQPGNVCDSGTLLDGRDNISSGLEPNQPNTIYNSCADNTLGTYHVDESIDKIKVSTIDGSNFSPGKTVKIEVTVWVWQGVTSDFLDLYYATDAINPTWTYLTTLVPSVAGLNVLSTTYTLPSGGSLQAVRAHFRWSGAASPCGGGGSFDDYDDLIFASTTSPLQLMLDESGPAADQVAALDSLLFLRDPFLVINSANVLNPGADRNTRLIVFVSNLQLAPGETASAVVVNLVDSNGQSYDVAAVDVRSPVNMGFTQVVFRLPNNLAVGTCTIRVKAHSQTSNSGTIRIRI